MVEFAGLEKLGCGIGFGYIFPVRWRLGSLTRGAVLTI